MNVYKLETCAKALDEILDIDIGVYPRSFTGGEKAYKKRTQYMEGWNEASKLYLRAIVDIFQKHKIDLILKEEIT